MAFSGSLHILSRINSSKIKDRNEGIEELSQLIDQGTQFTNKEIIDISGSLFELIDQDKKAYTKSNSPAPLTRLKSSCYVLRRLITDASKKMKATQMLCVLDFVQTRFLYRGEVFSPIATDLSRMLYSIVSSQGHRNHILSQNGISLIDMIIRVLKLHFKNSTSEPYSIDLLQTLKLLLRDPLITLYKVVHSLSGLVCDYFDLLKKENSTTQHMVEIANLSLIHFATVEISLGIKIVKSVTSKLTQFLNTNYEQLKEQYLIFNILSSEYISNKIPLLIDEKGLDVAILNSEFKVYLSSWINSLMQNQLRLAEDSLKIDMIEFHNVVNTDPTWVQFPTMSLKDKSNIQQWIGVLGIVSLLNSYFQLNASEGDQNEAQPWKRVKLDPSSFEALINVSDSSIELYKKMLKSHDNSVKKLGLMLLSFHSSLFKTDSQSITIQDLMIYDQPSLSPWISLCINLLLHYGWDCSTQELSQILRINIQMLKDVNSVSIACQTIITVLSSPQFLLSDRSLVQLVESTFDPSEVNGPIVLNNDAMKFWVLFADLGKPFSFNEKKAGDKVLDWALSKWNSVSSEEDLSLFPEFVGWLAGSSFQDSPTIKKFDTVYTKFFAKWKITSLHSRFILKHGIRSPISKVPTFWPRSWPSLSVSSLEPLLDKFLDKLVSFDGGDDVVQLARYVGYGLLIIQKISEIPELSSSAERIKYDVRRLSDNLRPRTKTKQMELISTVSNFKVVNKHGLFIIDSLQLDDITRVVDLQSQESPAPADDFGDFGIIRKVSDLNDESKTVSYSDLACLGTLEQSIVKLVIKTNTDFGYSNSVNAAFDQALIYLQTLKSERFCYALYELVGFLETVQSNNLQTTTIKKLIREFGSKMLTDYNFNKSPIVLALMSRFSLMCSTMLLTKAADDILADFIDIQSWFLDFAKKRQLVEEYSISLFSRSLFQLLVSADGLEGTDPQGMYLTTLDLVKNGSNFVKVYVSDHVGKFVTNLPWKKKMSFFDEFISSFKSPQSKDETSASLILCLQNFAVLSSPYFMGSIRTILSNANYHHFGPYAVQAIPTILKHRGISSLENISTTASLDLSIFWFKNFKSFDNFPYDLFGYSSLKEFFEKKISLLYPVICSRAREGGASLNSLLHLADRPSDELELESMSWLLPLSYTQGGVRNAMVAYLERTYDRDSIEYQSRLIIKNMLLLIDVSEEKKFLQCIPGLESLPFLKDLITEDSLDLYGLDHAGVKLSDGVHQIVQLSGTESFWSASVVYFLVKHLILEFLEAFTKEEKVLALRRLKLLLILGYEGFRNEHVLTLLCNVLGNALCDPDVHVDSALIISVIFRIFPGSLCDSKLYPGPMLSIYHNASKYSDSGNEVSEPLVCLLMEIYSEIGQKRPWKLLFTPFVDTLRGQAIRLTLPLIHDSLKYATQITKLDMKQNLINSMEVMFEKKPDASLIPLGFKTNTEVAKYLKDVAKLKPNKHVMVFISRYLGRYYLETGDDLEEIRFDFERSIEYTIETSSKTLNNLFKEVAAASSHSKNLKNQFLLDDVLGYVLNYYNKDPRSVEELLLFEGLLSEAAGYLLPLDKFLFQVLHPSTEVAESISDLVSEAGEGGTPVAKWSQCFCIAILSELKSISPIISPLISYLSIFPDVSVKIINHLWLLYAHSFKEAQHLLVKFVINVLDSGEDSSICDEQIKVVLELCHLLRAASKDSVKPFVAIYKKLDLTKIYERACAVGLNKFALLVLEEDAFANNSITEDELDCETLTKVYEGLDDLDLLYGVPIDPTLDYAMNMINKASTNTSKSLMLNSAKFDSSIIFENAPSAKTTLLNSLTNNNLEGLSSLVNDYMDPMEKLSKSYEWHWKLNRWDIPAPFEFSTENEMLYTILKSVKDQTPQTTLKSLCETSLVRMADLGPKTVMRSLGILYSIETLVGLPYLDLNSNVVDFNRSTDNWLSVSPFSSFDNLLLSRRVVLENLFSRIGLEESLLATSQEISRYGALSRLHFENQRSVNSTVVLDNIVKSLDESPLQNFLKRLSSYESASTLWALGETVIPIAMVESNLSQKVSYQNANFPLHYIQLPDSVLNSLLVKWNSESRQKKFEQTMAENVETALKHIDEVTKSRERAQIYHSIGYFCYKQAKIPGADDEIKKRIYLLNSKRNELAQLAETIKNTEKTERERKEAKRFYLRIQLQYEADNETYKTLVDNRNTCIEKAIEMFLKTISTDDLFDDQDVDKFSALWLEYSNQKFVNTVVAKNISNVPNHKFIPWINQLVSRLAYEDSDFQKNLQKLLSRISRKHPYHSLFFIMNLRAQKHFAISNDDKIVASRTKAAEALWRSIAKQDTKLNSEVLSPIDEFSMRSIELASEKMTSKERKMHLQNLKIGDFWMNKLPTLNLPLPTMNSVPIAPDGNYESLPRIKSVDSTVTISSSGISLPKIMTVYLNNGETRRLLLKGGSDDLRQDAIMEQVFEKVNVILQKDKETRKRNLRIRTYKVVPLGPTSGIIEFVSDSIALSDILRPLHRKDQISFDEARHMMKEAQGKSDKDRIAAYTKISKGVKPLFRNFFYETFLNVDDWYESRQVYTKGVVTSSIIGYVLGLGDRHLNNILIDKKTGEPIHIDLGVAFDQGTLLPVPETVPFRLTRDLVDGLGVTGVKGSFEKGSEHVYRVMRENVEKIIGILDVLKYDPLYSWAISPIRKKKLQNFDDISKVNIEDDGSDAGRAVKGVEDKLKNNGLSVEATVQQLVQEATDPNRLALIYLGWSPFY